MFDTFTTCPRGSSSITTGTALAVGTLTTRTLSVACAGAVRSDDVPTPHTDPAGAEYPASNRSVHAWPAGSTSGSPAVITLQRPVNYLGVYWFFGNTGDQFVLRSGGQDVISFSSADLITLIPVSGTGTVTAVGGTSYQRNHYLGGRKGFGYGSNVEPAVYINFVAPPGISFDEVRLSAGKAPDNPAPHPEKPRNPNPDGARELDDVERHHVVGEGGLEPPRPFEHWHLKPARLPFRHSPE